MFDLQVFKDRVFLETKAIELESFSPSEISANKWILVSSLQKSIRSGSVQSAIDSAYSLFRMDPAYLFWRLRIIASEDISLGNVDLANKIILFSSYQKEYEYEDKLEVLLNLVSSACLSDKDKASHYVSWWLKYNYSSFISTINFSNKQLVAAFNKEGQTIYEKTLILWLLVGSKYVPLGELYTDPAHEIIHELLDGVDQSVQAMFAMSLATQKETHFLAAPIMSTFYKQRQPAKRDNHLPQQKIDDGGIIVSAYDGHTSAGKRMISEEILSNDKLRRAISLLSSSPDKQVEIFSRVLFINSGNLMNKELWSPAHDALYNNVLKFNVGEYSSIVPFVKAYIGARGKKVKAVKI